MDTKIPNVTLKMWEKTMMSESIPQDGKYVKTGNKIEKTTYTFLDEFGSKLVFLGDSELRRFEGKTGTLFLKLEHDNFKKINKVQLHNFDAE